MNKEDCKEIEKFGIETKFDNGVCIVENTNEKKNKILKALETGGCAAAIGTALII